MQEIKVIPEIINYDFELDEGGVFFQRKEFIISLDFVRNSRWDIIDRKINNKTLKRLGKKI